MVSRDWAFLSMAALVRDGAFKGEMARLVTVETLLVVGAILDFVVGIPGLADSAIPSSSLWEGVTNLGTEGNLEIALVEDVIICWSHSC